MCPLLGESHQELTAERACSGSCCYLLTGVVAVTTEHPFIYGCPVLQAALSVVGGIAIFAIISGRTVWA
jgi:hypothetical protein